MGVLDPTRKELAKMLMSKKNRVAIYEQLFNEGVLVALKDTHAPKHPELPDIPNLQVIKALQSLKSRGYVREQFSWKHYYWYLTNEGITYLRDYLHLPPEIVPATLKRQTRSDTMVSRRGAGMGGPRDGPKPTSDRQDYRRQAPASPDKQADVGPGTGGMEFRGGFGRGRGMQQ